MLSSLSIARQLAQARASGSFQVASRSKSLVDARPAPLTSKHLQHAMLYHSSRKALQSPFKSSGNIFSKDDAAEREMEAPKMDSSGESGRVTGTSNKKEAGEASASNELKDKSNGESHEEQRNGSESGEVTSESKEDERAIVELASGPAQVALVSNGNPGLIARRGRKRSTVIKGGTRSFTKGLAAFEEGSLEDEELALFRLLSNHLSETLSLLSSDPRHTSLASFPSLSEAEQKAIDRAVQLIWDAPRFADLEIASFSHLTSPPVTSTMERSRTAMFGQVGFTLKAPQDHEAYMLYSLQRLAASYNAKFIDFDLRLLREAESIFTESLLQNEDRYSSASLFFQELVQDEEDFELFFMVLFELIHRSSAQSSVLVTPPPSSSSSVEKNIVPPLSADAKPLDDNFVSPTNETFVVAIRGMDQFYSFPHRKLKELLRACNKNVLFVELELTSQAQQPAGTIGFLGPLSSNFMLSPGSMNEEDEAEPAVVSAEMPQTLQSLLSRLSGSRQNLEKKNSMSRHFLGDDPMDFTHRKVVEADKIKADDAKKAAHEGSMRLASRLNLGTRPVAAEGSGSNESRSDSAQSLINRNEILRRGEEVQSSLDVLAKRELLQRNLKVLATCFRGINVMLVPDGAIQDANKAAETPIKAPIGTVTGNSIEEIPALLATTDSESSQASHGNKPYVRMWHPLKQCLSDYWLNPTSWKGPVPESFKTTLHLLSLLPIRIQHVERIVHRAIKLQDKHQYQKTGTWNHFSPTAGTLIRMTPFKLANLESENSIESTSNTTSILASLYGVQENTAVRMPLEVNYLHDSLRVELELDDKFESLPRAVRKQLPKSLEGTDGDSHVAAVSKLYFEQLRFKAQAVHESLWSEFAKSHVKVVEGEANLAMETQLERERADEEFMQHRLKGLSLNAAEKSMLQNYVAPSKLETSFDDIGSLEHAKEELLSLMVPMSLPVFHKENKLIKTPLGILLYGPPGTGKTMLAKALAKTANASFIHVSASSIVAKWLGESEGHAAAVFSLAKKMAPAIVFLDEVDGLLNTRDNAEHETSRRMKNEFFSGWDGLLSSSGRSDPHMSVTVVAATNRPYDLDSAALRRLPHRVLVNLPDTAARVEIIRKTLRGAIIAPEGVSTANVSEEQREQVISELARLTEGYSGSDINSVCTRAAQQHVRDFMKSQNVVELLKSTRKSATSYRGMSEDEVAEELEKEVEAQEMLNEKAKTFAKRPITVKEFKIALGEISASVNQRAGSSMELKKWHETYGSSPSKRGGRAVPSIGF